MGKARANLSVDNELLEQAKHLNINISAEFSEFLSNIVARHDDDVGGLNLRIENMEYDKCLKKINFWQNKAKEHKTNIEKIEKMQLEMQEKKLKQEKEKIETAKRCKNCGISYQDQDYKWHIFGIGNICRHCLTNASKDDIKRWSK